jgi:cell shape-determining protein MreD
MTAELIISILIVILGVWMLVYGVRALVRNVKFDYFVFRQAMLAPAGLIAVIYGIIVIIRLLKSQ